MGEKSTLGKVLVTGAAGFIGGHLARALQELECQTLLATRKPREDGNARWVPLDVCQPGALEWLLEKERPDTVFHLAGTRGHESPWGAAVACTDVNLCSTVRLLSAAKRVGVRRVVMPGSAEEYGRQSGPLDEETTPRPETPYGISRMAATRLAQLMYASELWPVVVVRPFTVYGPGQPRSMFVAQAIEAAVTGQAFQMTEGIQRRDLVFVEDVVRALLAAASVPEIEGRVINIGSGTATPLREVAALIWKLSESAAPLEIGARPSTPTELFDTWADIRLAEKLLGWKPDTSLEAGLRQTIDWARKKAAGWTG